MQCVVWGCFTSCQKGDLHAGLLLHSLRPGACNKITWGPWGMTHFGTNRCYIYIWLYDIFKYTISLSLYIYIYISYVYISYIHEYMQIIDYIYIDTHVHMYTNAYIYIYIHMYVENNGQSLFMCFCIYNGITSDDTISEGVYTIPRCAQWHVSLLKNCLVNRKSQIWIVSYNQHDSIIPYNPQYNGW